MNKKDVMDILYEEKRDNFIKSLSERDKAEIYKNEELLSKIIELLENKGLDQLVQELNTYLEMNQMIHEKEVEHYYKLGIRDGFHIFNFIEEKE